MHMYRELTQKYTCTFINYFKPVRQPNDSISHTTFVACVARIIPKVVTTLPKRITGRQSHAFTNTLTNGPKMKRIHRLEKPYKMVDFHNPRFSVFTG